MKLIALVTEPKLVDRILRHLEKNATAARAPPPPSKPLDENETVPAHVNV